jgi:hypothetical protein
VNLQPTVTAVLKTGTYLEPNVLMNVMNLLDYGIIEILGLVTNVTLLVKLVSNQKKDKMNVPNVQIQMIVLVECSVAHQCLDVFSQALTVIPQQELFGSLVLQTV